MDKGYKKEDCSDIIANIMIYKMLINNDIMKDKNIKAQHVCNKYEIYDSFSTVLTNDSKKL